MLSRLQIERFAPLFFAAACTVAWWVWGGLIPDAVAKELLSALVSAAAISAGFMTTAMAILMPMGGTAVGRRLKRRRKLPYLFGYLKEAVYSCLAVVAICIFGFFVYTPGAGVGGVTAASIVAAATYSAAAMVRVIEIVIIILSSMGRSQDGQDGNDAATG